MVILTMGLPCSGKSTFVSGFVDMFSPAEKERLILLQPESLYPSDIEQRPRDEIRSLHIAAWEACIDQFYDEVKNRKEYCIILDTCGSHTEIMIELMQFSKKQEHAVYVVFVHTSKEICKSRAKNRKLDESVWNDYSAKFKNGIKSISSIADDFVVVRGINSFQRTKEIFKKWAR